MKLILLLLVTVVGATLAGRSRSEPVREEKRAIDAETEGLIIKETVNFLLGMVPYVGPILAKIQSNLWPKEDMEAKIMTAVKKEMGKQRSEIDIDRVLEAQRKFAKSYNEYSDYEKLLEEHPKDTQIMGDIRSHLGDAQESCNRIESQLETMKHGRKHAMAHAALSATLCMSFYRAYITNITRFYPESQSGAVDSVKRVLLCQMKRDRDAFVRLGSTMNTEWRKWRRDGIKVEVKTGHRCGGMMSSCNEWNYGTVTDEIKSENKQTNECRNSRNGGMYQRIAARKQTTSCLNQQKEAWFNKAVEAYGIAYEPMREANLERFLEGLGTPDLTACRANAHKRQI